MLATNLVLTGIKADKKSYEHKTLFLENRRLLGRKSDATGNGNGKRTCLALTVELR